MDFQSRKLRLQQAMQRVRVDALLVTHLPDIRYLCGFTGSNGVLAITSTAGRCDVRLFTDGRYTAQAKHEVQGCIVRIVKGSVLAHATAYLANSSSQRCGFDSSRTTVQNLAQMRQVLASDQVKEKRASAFFKPVAPLVSVLREVKEQDEIVLLRKAALVGCELYEGMLGWIEVGMREVDVAAELEYRARRAGAEAMSFETIVASGVRSSMPHARATAATLEPGTLLTLDFGIILGGYCSDMTRTVYLGGAAKAPRTASSDERQRVFLAVFEAQETAVAAVREGVCMVDVDQAARSVLRRAGLAKHFTHSTGHGIGLEIHEAPRIAAGQTQQLQAGMVVTIEPGAYLPERFGVRIEDSVVVTKDGCEILTPAYRGWVEL